MKSNISELRIITLLAGSITLFAAIVIGWVMAFRSHRLGWVIVTAAILAGLPLGLLVLSLGVGAPPPPDPDGGADTAGAAWGMMLLPALLLWVLAATASALIPALAWLARKISE